MVFVITQIILLVIMVGSKCELKLGVVSDSLIFGLNLKIIFTYFIILFFNLIFK
jgi:hypothetical protein